MKRHSTQMIFPYNLQKGKSKSKQLYFSGNSCEFSFGSNTFIIDVPIGYPSLMIPLMIDGIPLLSFVIRNHQLLLNANIFDNENKVILQIITNQLVYSIDSWDITFFEDTLTIHSPSKG